VEKSKNIKTMFINELQNSLVVYLKEVVEMISKKLRWKIVEEDE